MIIKNYSQRAPASLRSGTKVPLIWEAITRSMAPISFPPMKTTGTGCEFPSSRISAVSKSLPLGSWSSSYTVGFTPIPQKSLFTAWHMQQLLKLNITTAFSEASFTTLSIGSDPMLLVGM
ncbi:hypothetical protein V6Z11_D02G204100 [Gossypium hirsutum]